MTTQKHRSEKVAESRQRISSRRRKKWANLDYLQPLFDEGIADRSPVKYHKCLNCSSVITQNDGKLQASYCNKRFCAVCNHRRTAILIDKFLPEIKESISNGGQFKHITLTFGTKNNNNLQKEYDLLWKAWKKTRRSVKYHIRNGDIEHTVGEERLSAIVKLEINYKQNEKYPDGKYHPHLHLIVKGNGRLSKFLKDKWLEMCHKIEKDASSRAQNTTNVYSQDALLEVFKYVHKPVDEDGNPYPPEVIDNIFRTLKGKRILRTYGDFRNQNDDKTTEEEVEEDLEDFDPSTYAWKHPEKNDCWKYDKEHGQWFSMRTGETLLDTEPAHAGGRALTSQDNPDKTTTRAAATDPLTNGAITVFEGHMRKLSPEPEDDIFRRQIKRSWEEWKVENL